MSNREIQRQMLKSVAKALGDDLLQKVAFVGGCTTGLLVHVPALLHWLAVASA